MAAITMFFNGGLIPTFLLVNNLGLYNSRWAMVPRGGQCMEPDDAEPFHLILRQPSGVGQTGRLFDIIFLKIHCPVHPIIAVLIVFYAVGH